MVAFDSQSASTIYTRPFHKFPRLERVVNRLARRYLLGVSEALFDALCFALGRLLVPLHHRSELPTGYVLLRRELCAVARIPLRGASCTYFRILRSPILKPLSRAVPTTTTQPILCPAIITELTNRLIRSTPRAYLLHEKRFCNMKSSQRCIICYLCIIDIPIEPWDVLPISLVSVRTPHSFACSRAKKHAMRTSDVCLLGE